MTLGDPSETTHFFGRFVHLPGTGTGTGTGTVRQVFVYECQHDCGPHDTDRIRLVDIVPNANVTADDPDPYTPVYGRITPCQKDWEHAERYIDYDMGGGHVRTISEEMTLFMPGMADCTNDRDNCIFQLLEWNGVDGWTGSVVLNNGTASFKVHGSWNGLNEEWFVDYTGCISGTNVPLGVQCERPLILTGTGGGGPFGLSCCDVVPAPEPYYVWEKMPPIYYGRMAHLTEPGTGTGTGTGTFIPMFITSECCDVNCPPYVGCCPGIPRDANIDFTVFNVVTTTPNPPCTRSCGPGVTQTPTTASACITFSVDNCAAPNTICLECSGTEEFEDDDENWRNYRIVKSSVAYPPSSGSCNPFTVTFLNIPWSSPNPAGLCEGTVSVTVTI